MFALDRHLLLLLHGFVNVDALSDLHSGHLDVGDYRVEVDVLCIIVELARRLLVIEHELQVVTALPAIFSKREAVLPLSLRYDGYDAELLRVLVDRVVKFG